MASGTTRGIDAVGWQLLRLLQEDARQSYAELARQVGMSVPAVAERVRRMEEAGIVTAYRAELAPDKLGLELTVFIELTTPPSQYKRFLAMAQKMPEIRECHHVTGSGSFIIKALIDGIRHLEPVVAKLGEFGETRTSIVMSSPVEKRVIEGGREPRDASRP
ncbi:Lrp/AsnC family transcriptional regulator [Oxalobacteraceae bacterium OM1]|nr:Lrp/AsnC family transcriptional regulator [Oxalobacteraceae bacterium OM1]